MNAHAHPIMQAALSGIASDPITDAVKGLQTTAKAMAREAYYRALRDARDAVAGLTDGDSPIHDGAIVEACDAIERLPLPPELREAAK